MVAFSDGPRPASYTQLSENHVAVSLFTLVVNDRVRLRNLRVADVRRLYRGEIRSWAQLGGPDLPVVLVSRTSGSGTRRALQDRVLAGGEEPRTSSDDCTNRTVRSVPVLRCELDSTDQVLDAVARIPGALGYSELRAATELKGLHRLSSTATRRTSTTSSRAATRTARSSSPTPTAARPPTPSPPASWPTRSVAPART